MHAHHNYHAKWNGSFAVDRQPLHLKQGRAQLQASLTSTPHPVYYEADTMRDGKRVWGGGSHSFSRVPEVLVGGALLRTIEHELRVGTRFSICCSAAAVVYLLVDPHKNGGWDESLPYEGWQCLGQCGPLVSGASRMEMYRFDLPDAQTLHVPPTTRVASAAVVAIPQVQAQMPHPAARRAALMQEMDHLKQELRRRETELEQLEGETPVVTHCDCCTPPSHPSCPDTARSISPEEDEVGSSNHGGSNHAEDVPPPAARVHERGVLGRTSMRGLVEECLGRKLTDREFRDAYKRMDPHSTGGVHVRSFVDWLDTPPAPPPKPKAQTERPEHFKVRPCEHNEWDSVRAKHGVALLRCRVCATPWRTVLSNRDGPALWHRCSAFDRKECNLGPSCPALHVHRRKQTPEATPDKE
eukprot:Hpha_TRINITY_DN13184_c1_g1::TRINITY_DN13184_c1_g1_i1::g.113311::m.113311